MHQSTLKRNTHNSFVLQNVSDARARKLKAEVDPKGPDHNERSRYPQHSPWRHLIHKLCYFKHLKDRKKMDSGLTQNRLLQLNFLTSNCTRMEFRI